MEPSLPGITLNHDLDPSVRHVAATFCILYPLRTTWPYNLVAKMQHPLSLSKKALNRKTSRFHLKITPPLKPTLVTIGHKICFLWCDSCDWPFNPDHLPKWTCYRLLSLSPPVGGTPSYVSVLLSSMWGAPSHSHCPIVDQRVHKMPSCQTLLHYAADFFLALYYLFAQYNYR